MKSESLMIDPKDRAEKNWGMYPILKDENVKFIFDYVKNATVAASVVAAGVYVHKSNFYEPTPVVSEFLGLTIGILGIALVLLNYLHGIRRMGYLPIPNFVVNILAFFLNIVTMAFFTLLTMRH